MIAAIHRKIAIFGSLVKFSHSIFALPFALSMAVVVSGQMQISVWQVVWIVVAMLTARTAAMAFNRLVDLHFDARNPRTKGRELPSGKISWLAVVGLTVVSSLGFIVSASMLGGHCLILAPLVLAILLFYSFTKRFTAFSHIVLGLSLALAPGGVWYALTATFAFMPVLLMVAVMFWVAGFDILYSCQDVDYDRSQKLFSIPAKLGVTGAFRVARLFHCLSVLFLAWFGMAAHLHQVYWIGLGLFVYFLVKQHYLVSPQDLSKIDQAFFVQNGMASLGFLVAVLLDRLSILT